MPTAERIRQGAHHHVDHLDVTHARAPACSLGAVHRAAHAFDAAADSDIGLAQLDRICCGDDGLQARATQAVKRQRRGLFTHAGIDTHHARHVHVARFGVYDVAEYDLTGLERINPGPCKRFLDSNRAQLARREILQRATICPDRGTCSADDNYFSCVCHAYLLVEFDLTV